MKKIIAILAPIVLGLIAGVMLSQAYIDHKINKIHANAEAYQQEIIKQGAERIRSVKVIENLKSNELTGKALSLYNKAIEKGMIVPEEDK